MARVSKYSDTEYVRRHKPDYGLVAIVIALLLIGLIVVYTTSPALDLRAVVIRQLTHIGLGIGAFALTAYLSLDFWRKIQLPLILVALLSSLALLLPGLALEINGATRWVDLGFISFQPAEIIKFALIIYMASFLSQRKRFRQLDDNRQTLIPVLIISSVVAILVAFLQRDLGTMVTIIGIIIMVFYVSGAKFRQVLAYTGVISAAGVLTTLMFPHRMARVLTFFNGGQDIEGAGYHINQALIAIGSGGLFGRGLGQSVQAFGYLPEAINDSIFAIVAEEFGFVGSLIVLVLFGVLFVKMIRIMQKAPNEYMRLLVAGVLGWLFAHTVINIGAMLGLLPVTGITLPFLSFGGTSLLFIMAGVGLVFNVSRYTSLAYTKEERTKAYAHRTSRRRHGRARYATQSYRI